MVHADIVDDRHRCAEGLAQEAGALCHHDGFGIIEALDGDGKPLVAAVHGASEALGRLEKPLGWNGGRKKHPDDAASTRMLAEQRDKVMDGPDSIRRKSLGLGAGLPTILSRCFATVSGTAAGAATIAERHIAARHIAEQPAERAPGCAVRRIEGDLQRLFRERMI